MIMKNFALFITTLLLCVTVIAQVPQGFKYQAVARDVSGNVLANKSVAFRISILSGSETGSAVYSEVQKKTTNGFGLVDFAIGSGTNKTGSFEAINWSDNSYFVKVELDPAGGTAYQAMGTSLLMSVPYALHAKTVEVDKVDDADADPANEIQTISKTGSTVTLSKGGGSVSIDDADADATNEIQALGLSGTSLTLSKGGGTVTLPSSGGGDNWGTQTVTTDATLTGNGTAATPLKIAQQSATNGQVLKWNGTTWIPGNEADTDPVNEIQSLSISGNDLSLSKGGGTVTLPIPAGFSLPFAGSSHSINNAFSVKNNNGVAIVGFGDATEGNTFGVIGSTSSGVGIGISGINKSTTGIGLGVSGQSYSNEGVAVRGIATSSSGSSVGVEGSSYSENGSGVVGYAVSASGEAKGVYGLSNAMDGTGVHGESNWIGVKGVVNRATGYAYGIMGEVKSPDGIAIYGNNYSSSGFAIGIQGKSASTSGTGIHGESNYIGVRGVNSSKTGGYGVKGEVNSLNGIAVMGESMSMTGNTVGIYGATQSSAGIGVYGSSVSGSGITKGIIGNVNSPDGYSGYFTGGKFYVQKSVGIGTEYPSTDLSLYNPSNNCWMNLSNSQTGNTLGLILSLEEDNAWLINREPGNLYLYTQDNGMVINPNGNVGIGHIAPQKKLDVDGAINIRGEGSWKLYCKGAEAIWYNDTYFSWGYGGTWNYFGDKVFIGTTATDPGSNLLVVNGTAAKPGGGSWATWSDIRLKDVHGNFEKGINEIIKLQPVTYSYKKENAKNLPSDKNYVGFVAQDVQKVFPEAVTEETDGFLSLDVNPINVAVINALKELKAENDKLKAENRELRNDIKLINERLSWLEK